MDNGDISSETLIECEDSLDVSVLTDFKALLAQAAEQNMPVVLDGSRIERIDAAALQLIYSFFIHAKDAGFSVSWRAPSDTVCNAARLSGVTEAMGL